MSSEILTIWNKFCYFISLFRFDRIPSYSNCWFPFLFSLQPLRNMSVFENPTWHNCGKPVDRVNKSMCKIRAPCYWKAMHPVLTWTKCCHRAVCLLYILSHTVLPSIRWSGVCAASSTFSPAWFAGGRTAWPGAPRRPLTVNCRRQTFFFFCKLTSF